MRSLLAGTALALAAAWQIAPIATAADIPAAARPQAQSVPRHPDDLGAGDEQLMGMSEPYALVLLLGGLVASLILVRGRAPQSPGQTVKRLPGDAS